MGLGTGLNAFLSLLEAERSSLSITYIAVESDPLTQEEASHLNYASILNPEKSDHFNQIHNSSWEVPVELSENFKFLKLQGNIEDIDLYHKLDLIYFDAFAPTVQPHLWERELHLKLFNRLNHNGCLVTYCSKGSFRRCLTDIGYKVDRLNGPGKKREMLRGIRVS